MKICASAWPQDSCFSVSRLTCLSVSKNRPIQPNRTRREAKKERKKEKTSPRNCKLRNPSRFDFQIVNYYTGMSIPIRLYILMLIPAVLLLSQIRNLKYMAPFSIMANVSIIIGFVIMLYYIFNGIEIPQDAKLVASVGQWPNFFATVLFAIEGIGVVSTRARSKILPRSRWQFHDEEKFISSGDARRK